MKGFIVAVIAVLAIFQMMAEQGEAITCSEVAGDLAKCVPYLTKGGDPDPGCCKGVQTLVGSVKSPQDKRDACQCVKDAASHVPTIKDDAAQALPGKCGVTMDIPISKTVDCTKV